MFFRRRDKEEDSDDEEKDSFPFPFLRKNDGYAHDSATRRETREYDSPFFHLIYPAERKHCEQCHTAKGRLQWCAQCHVVFYCCIDCQQQNWVVHRAICRYTCTVVKQYQSEESAIQKKDYFQDPLLRTAFTNSNFAKMFLQALSNCIKVYTTINTDTSLQEAVKLGFKALYHNRKDDMDIRYELPALLLRLDMDQECYDMIMWYTMYGKSFQYENPNKPFLSLWSNDRSCLLDHADQPQLTFIIADVILKHRVLALCKQKESMYTFIMCMEKVFKQHPGGHLKGVYERVYKYILGDKLKYVVCRDPVLINRTIYKTMKQGEKVNSLLWRTMCNTSALLSAATPDYPGVANSTTEAEFHLARFKYLFRYIPHTLQYIADFCQKEYGVTSSATQGHSSKKKQHSKKNRR